MSSVFSKIINGQIPCHKVMEDDAHLAFLDISPLTKGHTLVIPKKEVDYIFDLNPIDLAALHIFSQKVAKLIKLTIPCTRVGVTVIGLEVPHAHIHLIPFTTMDEMNFARTKLKLSSEELAQIAQEIRAKV